MNVNNKEAITKEAMIEKFKKLFKPEIDACINDMATKLILSGRSY